MGRGTREGETGNHVGFSLCTQNIVRPAPGLGRSTGP